MRLRNLLPVVLAFPQVVTASEWIVGPGGFSDLQSAYAAAAPGDVIRIRQPSIPPFVLSGKGVVIRGDGLVPVVQPFDNRISAVPAGQVLVIEDLHIDGGLELRDCVGTVVLHRVICWSPSAFHTRAITALKLERCSMVHAYDSTFIASSQLSFGVGQRWEVGCGVCVRYSRAAFRNCRIEGCDGFMWVVFTWPYVLEAGAWAARPLEVHYSSVCIYSCTPRAGITYGSGGGRAGVHAVLMSSHQEPVSELVLGDGAQWEVYWSNYTGTLPPPRVRYFGSPPQFVATGFNWRGELMPLPKVDAAWIEGGQTLSIQARDLVPGDAHFLGVSLAARYWFDPGLEVLGALLIDVDRSRSALLDVMVSPGSYTWSQTYRLSQSWLNALRDRPLYFQAFSLDFAGRLRCSMPAFAMR